MTRVNDPYMDDPYFRDALIVNRSGSYAERPNLDRPGQGTTWKRVVLTLGAIVIIAVAAYSSFGGRFGTTDSIANVTMSTIGQGR